MNDRHSVSKLKLAVVRGDLIAARRLIKGGTDVNSPVFEQSWDETWETSLLHEAVISRHLEIVQLLLKHGAEVNTRDMNGDTPLNLACRRNDLPIVQALLQKQATFKSYNKDKETAFDIAVKKCDLAVIHALIRAPNHHGVLDIAKALRSKHTRESRDTVDMLIQRGARLNLDPKEKREGVLEAAVSNDASTEVIELLVEHGANPFYTPWLDAKSANEDGERISGHFGNYILKRLYSNLEALRRVRPDCSTTIDDVIRSCPDDDVTQDLLYIHQSQERVQDIQNSASSREGTVTDQSVAPSHLPIKSLQHKCRVFMRRHLNGIYKGKSINQAIRILPLHLNLVDYILCKELNSFYVEKKQDCRKET